MLELNAIQSGYGETRVIHGLDLTVREGTVHALLGRNGVGKSTTLKTIIGHLRPMAGKILLDGASIGGKAPHQVSRMGVAYVPETRDVFGALSVKENLELAGRLAPANPSWTIERVIDFFPNLGNRMSNGGHELSGGEQQMLAIGRALMTEPRILLLDEPTEGLAPIIIQQIFSKLKDLKAEGLTILLVEQNFNFAAGLADEISLVGRGQCVWHGTAAELAADSDTHQKWLGV
ncbi:ABC transporter ATP-binding protein [Actibacterium sp.]|uniref:ABC transporter ATP-binding protein n=1 Tax=Actibacterium sp. TaxID=1872125 RepID=UPI00356B3FC2